MTKSFKRLERVLRLEAQQGYRDKAVVGGIRQFATFWVDQARDEVSDEADLALVEQTADVLMGYGRLPGIEKRAEAIDGLLARLGQRIAREPAPPRRERRQRESQPSEQPTRPPEPEAPPAEASKRQRSERQERRQPAGSPKNQEPQRKTRQSRDSRGRDGGKSSQRSSTKQRTPRRKRIKADPDPAGLTQPVTVLKGVGPQVAEKLAKLGVHTVADALYLYPRRYDDYTLMKPIQRVEVGEVVTVIGTIWQVRARRSRNNSIVVQAVVGDGSGNISVNWYNQKWLMNKLSAGMQIAISGKVEQFLGRPVFNSPEWEPVSEEMLKTGRIVPVYPLTEGLGPNKMRSIMLKAVEYWAPRATDVVPAEVLSRQKLIGLQDALFQIHLPESQEELFAARQRLAFDELFMLQVGMLTQRAQWQDGQARSAEPNPELLQQFISSLPYDLTGAQQRVIDEIGQDMAQAVPMTRLLQGDVGAGKTVVAAGAMLLAIAAGGQAALMAPTEILAEQHFRGLSELLQPLGVNVALLTGSTTASEKETILGGLASGEIQLAIGTHALIQPTVNFAKLQLAVVDEQHRFGVDQRRALRDRSLDEGYTPHLLAMSATPIPRTLALSLYGDLDLSMLDEMPPGRQPIDTHWMRPYERERAYGFVRSQVEQGRQAYVICPLVEESDKIEAKSAVEEHARLQKAVFPQFKLGLLHGRMRGVEKEAVMRAFKEGQTNILVSTSVIEVGVDVPNSTIMVIEGANRFGLAQLHQFRGRVGRGSHKSTCLLIADSTKEEAAARLKALEDTNDGFVLAEKDLALRGPGEFFGKRQSGIPELRMASLLDMALVEKARDEAAIVAKADPELTQPEHADLRERVTRFWAQASDAS